MFTVWGGLEVLRGHPTGKAHGHLEWLQLQEGQHPNKGSGGHTVLSQTLRLTEKIHQKVGKGMNPYKKK